MRGLKASVAGILLIGLAAGAVATEGGGGAYPNGAEGYMTGALPPPGNYIINYNLYYSADAMKDGNGDTLPLDFDLEVWGEVLRLIHVSDVQILGGSLAQHIFVPFLNVDVGLTTPAGRLEDERFGIGDIIIDPFILGWHKGNCHWAAGVDIYLPTGSYDAMRLANPGRNYWTVEPVLAFTYLNPNGFEVSAKMMYDVNFENDNTDYKSGDELHVDYAVGQHIKNWTLGVGGFCYKQVESDEGDGVASDGNKGEQIAWGPQIAYQYKGMSVALAYQDEIETENKTEGERVWLKFVCGL